MPGCAAPNCCNHSRKGKRLFKFPASPRRRAEWLQNSRRDKWEPGQHAKLCEDHFEPNQYETGVAKGGKRKLRKTAVPSVFDVPNPPKRLQGSRAVCSYLTQKKIFEQPAGTTVAALSDHNYVPLGNVVSTPSDVSADSENAEAPAGIVIPTWVENGRPDSQPYSLEVTTPKEMSSPTETADAVRDKIFERSTECQASITKKQQRIIWRLQKENTKLRQKVEDLEANVVCPNIPMPFLTIEQQKMLFSGKRAKEWSPESIRDAIQLRFAVGWKGYKTLVKKGFPLPSYSTICRRLSTIDFSPGILAEILFYLKTKASSCNAKEKDCVLLLDEMDIAKGIELYPGMKNYVGNCTLWSVSEMQSEATQLLVVMLRGANSNWKQVVGYHFLSKRCSANTLSNFVKNLLCEIESTGYRVLGVVSDMGPKNQGIWRDLGLCVGKYSKMNRIKHPARHDEDLFFFADVPHLIKNLKQALLSHKFTIPPDIVENNNLLHDEVDSKYLKQLVQIQKDQKLKIACHLTARHLEPTQFEKMKVSMATQVFSERTASGIETLVQLGLMNSKALTTAWFLRVMREWFDILNSRCRKTSITRKNRRLKILKLQNIIKLITNVKIGESGHWKPLQTGILLSTTNMLALLRKLFSEGYSYILTSRLNQDALESLFSILRRHGNNHPSALQAAQALKLITISQFVEKHDENSANYATDDDSHYISMFSSADHRPREINVEECCESMHEPDLETAGKSSIIEENSMNTLLGGAIKTVLGRNNICSDCIPLIQQDGPTGRSEEVALTFYDNGQLVHPSRPLYDIIRESEQHIVFHLEQCINHKALLKHLVFKIKESVKFEDFNICKCKVGDAVLMQYVRLRLSIYSSDKKEQAKQANRKAFGSKSANMICIRE